MKRQSLDAYELSNGYKKRITEAYYRRQYLSLWETQPLPLDNPKEDSENKSIKPSTTDTEDEIQAYLRQTTTTTKESLDQSTFSSVDESLYLKDSDSDLSSHSHHCHYPSSALFDDSCNYYDSASTSSSSSSSSSSTSTISSSKANIKTNIKTNINEKEDKKGKKDDNTLKSKIKKLDSSAAADFIFPLPSSILSTIESDPLVDEDKPLSIETKDIGEVSSCGAAFASYYFPLFDDLSTRHDLMEHLLGTTSKLSINGVTAHGRSACLSALSNLGSFSSRSLVSLDVQPSLSSGEAIMMLCSSHVTYASCAASLSETFFLMPLGPSKYYLQHVMIRIAPLSS